MRVFYCNILLLGNLQKEFHEFGILKTYFPASVDIKPSDCYKPYYAECQNKHS